MYGVHSAQLLQVRLCVVETMSLVGYKIGYIGYFVSNPDWHLDSKWWSCNRGWWVGVKKTLDQLVALSLQEAIDPLKRWAAVAVATSSGN